MECSESDWVAVRRQGPIQVSLLGKLINPQDSTTLFDACGTLVAESCKVVQSHWLEDTKQVSLSQLKFLHEKCRSRAFQAILSDVLVTLSTKARLAQTCPCFLTLPCRRAPRDQFCKFSISFVLNHSYSQTICLNNGW